MYNKQQRKIKYPEEPKPSEFYVKTNPNPFNPSTNVEYSVPEDGKVRITVYNMLGQNVRDLAGGVMPAGRYHTQWNGKDNLGNQLSSGVYFVNLGFGNQTQTQKITLQR